MDEDLLQCCLCGVFHPLRNERGQAYEHMCTERRLLEANFPVVSDVARSIADMHFSRTERHAYEEHRFRIDFCRAPIPSMWQPRNRWAAVPLCAHFALHQPRQQHLKRLKLPMRYRQRPRF